MPLPLRALATTGVLTIALGVSGCERDGTDSLTNTAREDITAGLIGHWTFDDVSENNVSDSSGFGNSATINNGALGEGHHGTGLRMNGGDDEIVIVPMSASLESVADGITVMAWAYRTAEHNVAVVAHNYPALFFGFHGPQFKWQLRTSGGLLQRAVSSADFLRNAARKVGYATRQGASCYVDPSHRQVLHRWIHIAATFDGSAARLYADGIEICSEPISGSIRLADAPFTISGFLDDSGKIVDEITGSLDDIRIYDRALDADEIRAIFDFTSHRAATPEPHAVTTADHE